jgi:hypothetical protein
MLGRLGLSVILAGIGLSINVGCKSVVSRRSGVVSLESLAAQQGLIRKTPTSVPDPHSMIQPAAYVSVDKSASECRH